MVLKEVKAKPGSIIPPTVARVWEAYFNRCGHCQPSCVPIDFVTLSLCVCRFVASPVEGAPWWSAEVEYEGGKRGQRPMWSSMREAEDVERNVGHDGHRAGGQPAAERQQRGVVGGAAGTRFWR